MAYNLKLIILLFLVFGLLFGVDDNVKAACVGGIPDGTADTLGGEECDGGDLDGKDCNSQSFAWGGNLSCTGACTFDTSCCFGADPCNQNPTVAISPPAPNNAKAGTAITYMVTVTNNDDSVCGMCAARDFDLSVPAIDLDPALTYFTPFVSDPLTINAGGSGSTTFEISSDALTGVIGVYNFTIQATGAGDDTGTGAGTGTYTINALLEVCDNGVDTSGDGNLDTGDDDGDGLFDCDDPDCLGFSPHCCGNGTVEGAEICDTADSSSCPGTQICNPNCSSCISSVPNTECADGFDDCDCNGTCETDILTDMNNCGMCGAICGTVCINGSCSLVEGGLVPCGRMSDDQDTIWNEREDCKICHLIIFADSITGYLLGIVGIITVLSLVIGGMLYVTSSGNSNLVTTAKTAFRKSLYGFVIVFIAWVMTNTTMVLFGFDDPLGDGSWHKFDCDVSTIPPAVYICGDGIVTSPNDDGILEVCDPKESKAAFIARKTAVAVGCGIGGGCPNGCFFDEGVPDPDCLHAGVAWTREIYSCNFTTCDFGCLMDPLVDEIGGGCYLDLDGDGAVDKDECQKGRYACDFATGVVSCENTYNDINYKLVGHSCGDVLDYCCAFREGMITLLEARTILSNLGVTRIKHSAAWTDPAGSNHFHCDDVCKESGQICIGVGLTDTLMLDACEGVTCHSGSDCTGNTASIDCRLDFPFCRPGDHNRCTICNGIPCSYNSVNSPYYVGYTSCLCF